MPLALETTNPVVPTETDFVEEHFRQVRNSPQFARAETQRRLLEYLWAHRDEVLSEYALATDALGRKADFDSTSDASVRVHISRLRRKLKDYYQETGEPEILKIPTGTHQLVAEPPPNEAEEPQAIQVQPSSPAVRPLFRLRVAAFVIGLSVCFALTCLLGWSAGQRASALAVPRPTTFWESFLTANAAPIKIILPTPIFFSFASSKDIRVRSTRVNDFQDASTDPRFLALAQQLGKPTLEQNYTVTSDTLAAVSMARYLDSVGGRDRVSFDVMRDSDMLTLEQSNVIALGTYQTLEPLQEYLTAMNFALNHDEAAALNAHPLPGEQAMYPVIQESRERVIRPSVIALLPGRKPGLRVLIIESRHTAAIVSLLSSSAGVNSLESMLQSHGKPPYWEMVLETELNSEHALRTWPVTVHAFAAQAPANAM